MTEQVRPEIMTRIRAKVTSNLSAALEISPSLAAPCAGRQPRERRTLFNASSAEKSIIIFLSFSTLNLALAFTAVFCYSYIL